MSKTGGDIALDMVRSVSGHIGGAYGTALSESGEVRTLKTLVEMEGVRTLVTRVLDGDSDPVVRVSFSKQCEYASALDLSEQEINETTTEDMLERVRQAVPVHAAILRRVALDDALCGMKYSELRDALTANLDTEDMERLALELMSKVERLGK